MHDLKCKQEASHADHFHVLWHLGAHYFHDDKKHSVPHIHAEYGEHHVTCAIEDGRVLAGSLPKQKMKLVEAWLEIHREDLLANWKLAVAGEPVFRIDPLR